MPESSLQQTLKNSKTGATVWPSDGSRICGATDSQSEVLIAKVANQDTTPALSITSVRPPLVKLLFFVVEIRVNPSFGI